jgi:hypothetical protein
MGSKMVLDRKKSSESVQSAGTRFEDKMATSMVNIYGSEAEPATRTLIKLSVSRLKSDTDAMIRADDAHLKEISDDSKLIADRDEKSDAVRSDLVEIRDSAETVYGSDYVRGLGFEGSTPTDPVAVHSLATLVLDNLKTGKPPKPVKRGLSMDLGAWTSPLADKTGILGQALKTVSDDKRDADQTLVDKQRAMEKYDLTFSTTANLLSNMLKAAGEAELAKRVRPSSRKPGQTVEDAQDETTA